jgi:chitin disaccharide deacetylase
LKFLIVNADDLGLTEGVNLGILDAHFEGIVTSATLLANGSAFDKAVAMLASAPGLGVGIHLNLTEGAPVSNSSAIPTLVNGRNYLHLSPFSLWKGISSQRVSLSDVETELRAQITKVIRAGITPTHLDGHKHVHVVPPISGVVIRLAVEFGIPAMRCPVEVNPRVVTLLRYQPRQRISVLKQYLVGRGISVLAGGLRKKLSAAGLASPSNFHGLSQTGFLESRALERIFDALGVGTNELMCHPGFTDASLESTGTRLLAQREAELLALKTAKEAVAAHGIRLATYSQVVAPTQSRSAA